MAHPVAGGGVGPNGGKDVAHVAKLALLGLGTLATGAFGLVSLAAGYKYKKAHAPDPTKVTPQTYFDDLVHLVPPWQQQSTTDGGDAGSSHSHGDSSDGGMDTHGFGHHRDRENEAKSPITRRLGSPNLAAEAELEAELLHRAELEYWEMMNEEEEEALRFVFRPAAFAHIHTSVAQHTATQRIAIMPAATRLQLLSVVCSFLPFESVCVLAGVSRSLRDFANTLLDDRGFQFRLARSRAGFSEHVRGHIWMRVSGAGALAASMGQRASPTAVENFYGHLVRLTQGYRQLLIKQNAAGSLRSPPPPDDAAAAAAAGGLSSPSPGVDLSELTEESRAGLDTILKDVPRTMVPSNAASSSLISNLGVADESNPSASPSGQSSAQRQQRLVNQSREDAMISLGNLLSAYSLHDTELSYCQGMNFVASYLLQKLPEEPAYWLFYKVMQDRSWGLRNFYLDDLKGLLLCKYQFQFLFQLYLPDLHQHFTTQDIHSDIFTEWFMTLFTYSSFPRRYPLLDRLWDCMLVGRGLKYIHRVALSILYLSQATLLECDFEGIIFYLKHLPDDGILNPDIILPIALDYFRVSNRALAEIEQRYEADIREGENSKRRVQLARKQAKEAEQQTRQQKQSDS